MGINRVPWRSDGGYCSHYTTEGGAAGCKKRAVLVCSSLHLQNGWILLQFCRHEITEQRSKLTERRGPPCWMTSKVSWRLPKFRQALQSFVLMVALISMASMAWSNELIWKLIQFRRFRDQNELNPSTRAHTQLHTENAPLNYCTFQSIWGYQW